jgi:hypothetical protein
VQSSVNYSLVKPGFIIAILSNSPRIALKFMGLIERISGHGNHPHERPIASDRLLIVLPLESEGTRR